MEMSAGCVFAEKLCAGTRNAESRFTIDLRNIQSQQFFMWFFGLESAGISQEVKPKLKCDWWRTLGMFTSWRSECFALTDRRQFVLRILCLCITSLLHTGPIAKETCAHMYPPRVISFPQIQDQGYSLCRVSR